MESLGFEDERPVKSKDESNFERIRSFTTNNGGTTVAGY